MQGKTVLITGAAGGLGRLTALALARQGAHLIVHARSEEKAAPVVAEIMQLGGSAEPLAINLDVMQSVREGAARVCSKHPKLHALINNAGIWAGTREVTSEGFERTWAVNVLAPWLLTELLMEPLKAAQGARVINLSSNEHYLGKIKWDNLHLEKGYAARYAYRRSKLALTMLTNEFAARVAGSGIVANSLHPGVSGTGLFRNFSGFIQFWIRLLMRSAESCSLPVIRLASAPELSSETGRFFRRFNIRRPHRLARDAAACKRLRDIVASQVK